MPVSLAFCLEQVEALSVKLELNVTWERWPRLAGEDMAKQSALGQSCHQSSSRRDKAKCGSSHATYTFYFLLSSCPKKGRKKKKKRKKKEGEGWSGEKQREEKELLIYGAENSSC